MIINCSGILKVTTTQVVLCCAQDKIRFILTWGKPLWGEKVLDIKFCGTAVALSEWRYSKALKLYILGKLLFSPKKFWIKETKVKTNSHIMFTLSSTILSCFIFITTILEQFYKEDVIKIPILQIRKLKVREQIVWGHTAVEQQSRDLNLESVSLPDTSFWNSYSLEMSSSCTGTLERILYKSLANMNSKVILILWVILYQLFIYLMSIDLIHIKVWTLRPCWYSLMTLERQNIQQTIIKNCQSEIFTRS